MKKEWKNPELKKVQIKKITLSGSSGGTEEGIGDPAVRAKVHPNS